MTRRIIEIIAFCSVLLVAALAAHAWLASRDDQHRLAATLAAQKQLIDIADTNERARQVSLADALAQIEKLKRTTQTPDQIVAALQKYLTLPQPITLSSESNAASSSEQGIATSVNIAPITAGLSRPESMGVPPVLSTAEAPGLSEPQQQAAPTRGGPTAPPSVEGQGVGPDTNGRAQRTTKLPQSDAKASTPPQQPSSATTPAVPCDLAGDCAAQIPASDLKPLFDYVQDCRACQAQLDAAKQNSADDTAKIAALTRERDAAITAAKGGTFFRRLKRNAVWFAVGAAAGYASAKH
jgi:hypothetical protein